MENRENLHEWEKMLGESETLHLAVVEQSGYPMEKVSSVGLEQVLFITKKQSEKVRSLQKCKQCSIECHIEEKNSMAFRNHRDSNGDQGNTAVAAGELLETVKESRKL